MSYKKQSKYNFFKPNKLFKTFKNLKINKTRAKIEFNVKL